MTTNYQRTADWLAACGKVPGNEQHLSVQIGCHIEEFLEFMGNLKLKGRSSVSTEVVMAAMLALEEFADDIKSGELIAAINELHAHEALDALCDAEVTANGVAFLAGFNKVEADQAVLAANDAKLVDGKPLILEGGKIGKPEGWRPADLTPFVPKYESEEA